MNWMQDVMDAKKRGAMFPGDREECEMTDQIKQWLQDRRDTHANTTGCWEHDATEDGTNFWAGGGRSDFHLTVADAAFCVDAHNVAVPALLDALGKALELHKPINGFVGDPSHWECNVCGDERGPKPYPCPTVRAIADALGVEP